MVNVCPRCTHTRATYWCGSCHVTTQPFAGRPAGQDDELHICDLCGDPAEAGDDWCVSCAVDVELEIDEMLDEPRPESD